MAAVQRGLLLVVSGPSGAGKGTICNLVRKALPELGYSISVTTRQARPGEVDGVNYFFKTVPQFEEMIAKQELLEYAEVYGNYYGTPKEFVLSQLESGKDVLLEIDINGAMQVKRSFPEGVFVFIAPPSLKILSERLRGRGTDSEEVIRRRLDSAAAELGCAREYDYVLFNDVAEEESAKLVSILTAERSRAARCSELVEAVAAGADNFI